MAADDIFTVHFQFEGPHGAASSSLAYQQTVDATSLDPETELLANAVSTHMAAEILAIMSNEWEFRCIACTKHDGLPKPAHRHDNPAQKGVRVGPALPSNRSLAFELGQALHPPRSNGLMKWPPPREDDTLDGVITAAYQTSVVFDLAAKVQQEVAEESGGAGRWLPGVISAKIRDAALPFKDWAAAYSPVNGVNVKAILGQMRPRQTRVRGRGLL